MVHRLPAGTAICRPQQNACLPIGFLRFRGSHCRIQRPSRAAPGRRIRKTNGFPTSFRSAPPCVSQLPKGGSICRPQSVLALRRRTDMR